MTEPDSGPETLTDTTSIAIEIPSFPYIQENLSREWTVSSDFREESNRRAARKKRLDIDVSKKVYPASCEDYGDTTTLMLDISSKKEYMAYVTKHYHDSNSAEYSMVDKAYLGYPSYDGSIVKATFSLTIRSLDEVHPSLPYSHHTIDVTSMFVKARDYSVYSISISNDGKWISLSCFDPSIDHKYRAIYEVEKDRTIKRIKLTGEIADVPGYGVFFDDGEFAVVNLEWIYVFSSDYVMLRRFFLGSKITKYIDFNTTVSNLKSQQQICIFNLELASSFSKIPNKSPSWGIGLACSKIKKRLIRLSERGHFSQLFVIGDSLSSRIKMMSKALFTEEVKYDVTVISESNKVVLTSFINDSVEHLSPFDDNQSINLLYDWRLSSDQRYLFMTGLFNRRNVYTKVWDFWIKSYVYSDRVGVDLVFSIKPFIVLQHEDTTDAAADCIAKVYYLAHVGYTSNPTIVCNPIKLKRNEINCSEIKKVQSFFSARSFTEFWNARCKQDISQSRGEILFCLTMENDSEFFLDFLPYGLNCVISISSSWIEVNHYFPDCNDPSIQNYKDMTDKHWEAIDGFVYEKQFMQPRSYPEMNSLRLEYKHNDPTECIRLFQDVLSNHVILSLKCTNIYGEIEIQEYYIPLELEKLGEEWNAICMYWWKRQNEESSNSADTSYSKETEHDRRTMSRQEIYKRTDTTLIRRRFVNINATFTSSDNNYIFEKACESVIYQRALVESKGLSGYDSFFESSESFFYNALERIDGSTSHYFQTYSGTDTLARFASYPRTRPLLLEIIKKQGVKIHLVSDFDQDAKESQQCSRNPLVILIDAGDFELYKLLLNRVLLDSSDIKGVPISHCITEAVIELQRRGKKKLVLETINSFDYVPAGQHFWYPLESSLFFYDLSDYDSKKLVQSDSVFRTIFADEETSYHSSKMFRFFHSLWAYKQHLLLKTKAESTYSDESIARVDFYRRHGLRMCVVPLTCLSHYPSVDLDLHQLLLSDRYSSQFSFSKSRKAAEELIDDGYSLIYALILSYKWKKFVRIRFYQAFLIHLLFYIAYFLSIAFAQEVFGFVSGSSSLTDSNAHVVLIVLFFLTGTVLLIQEVRQFWSSPRKYMASFYNFFDLLVLLLTTINFIQMVCGVDYMIEVGSVCVLVIWLHGLLRLRVIYTIGHTLEIIIQLFHKVSQIILLMIVVVAAFSHAFIMLLRHQDDSYFQEKYTGTTNSSDPSADPNVAFSDGASNDFVDVFKSFKSVWFFIYGIWDPVTSGDAADNVMAAILAIAFSFIVLLIFFNIVIGFMSASIEEMIQQGKRAWLIHYSNVIMEIEQYWCFESNKEYFRHMYYVATDKEIENQQRRLQEESEYLIQHYDKLQHDGKRSPIVKPFFANDY